jgi:predicted phosphodiesterase
MKKIAIISDIHANLEALTMVLDDIKQKQVDAIYCLGDVIGYGPDPVKCLDLVSQECDFILLGNHEEAVLSGAFGFNSAAKKAIDWTRKTLQPHSIALFNKKATISRWKLLQNLPVCYTEEGYLFVHASPRDPTMDYILKTDTEDVFGEVPEKIREIFEQFDKICFVGHTHTPGIITEESRWFSPNEFGNVWEYKNNERLICNVGSVGQPRDRDERACYVICTPETITYFRVAYDYETTRKKIHDIKDLDERNGNRLQFGT